jgi:hypothetical protein
MVGNSCFEVAARVFDGAIEERLEFRKFAEKIH